MMWLFWLQSVKAYLRRGTAREFLGYYKEANDGKKHLLFGPCRPVCQLKVTPETTDFFISCWLGHITIICGLF